MSHTRAALIPQAVEPSLHVTRFRWTHVLFPWGQGSWNKLLQCNAERATEDYHFEIGHTPVAGLDLGDCGSTDVEPPNSAPGSQFVLAQAGRLPAPPYLRPHDVSGLP